MHRANNEPWKEHKNRYGSIFRTFFCLLAFIMKLERTGLVGGEGGKKSEPKRYAKVAEFNF
jgi:hypothetical protein